ncbi:TetR/AcrR family transcriptional regulator [Streptomyces sp. 900116325]
MPPRDRRTQQERTQATTAALLSAARELFIEDGFAATSLSAVCSRAGVTRGAFYHHFQSKEEIFSRVFAIEQRKLATAVRDTFRRYEDPWTGVLEGCRTLLTASLAPDVRQLTLVEAPTALGWAHMRDIQAHCRHQLKTGLELAVEAGCIPDHPLEPLTSFIYGGIGELTMDTARAGDDAHVDQAFNTLQIMLSGVMSETSKTCRHTTGPTVNATT